MYIYLFKKISFIHNKSNFNNIRNNIHNERKISRKLYENENITYSNLICVNNLSLYMLNVT